MSQSLKTCSSCRYYKPAYSKNIEIGPGIPVPYVSGLKDTCKHEDALKSISIVNGSKTYSTCEEFRSNYGQCGQEAKYYEETVKYCKDCKYYKLSFIFRLTGEYQYALCMHPKVITKEVGLVHPKITESKYCTHFRTDYKTIDTCGSEAKYYEPKN